MSMRLNVFLLALCEALYVCYLAVGFTLISLVGRQRSPIETWATRPFSLTFIASAIATIGASMLMNRMGRRAGFIVGALIGVLGGIVATWSIFIGSFVGFCLGNVLMAIYK